MLHIGSGYRAYCLEGSVKVALLHMRAEEVKGRVDVPCPNRPDLRLSWAAALDKHDVAPAAAVLADAFPGPDHAEPGRLVQGQAGGVFGEDAGLDGPDPGGFGRADQRVQELAADAASAGGGVDVDRVLDHPGVDAAVGHSRRGYPPGDPASRDRDEPVGGQPGRGEGRPVRHTGLEG